MPASFRPRQFDLIAFDWDGTLFDSTQIIVRCIQQAVADVGGAVLVVSQFTLYGDARKGRRPGFTDAARPEQAEPLIAYFVEQLRKEGLTVATGQFQAHMEVALVNDGPVTLWLDTAGVL